MFTGIITDIGRVAKIEHVGDTRFWIETKLDLAREDIGASIACSGACMTVVEKSGDQFLISVSGESLDKTNLKNWQVGSRVNLESALRIGDTLGGHFVTGHVDTTVKVLEIKPVGDSHYLKCELPLSLSKLVAPKGSITLDGIALTVNEASADYFTVNIIPHTWQQTTLGQSQIGTILNCEIDLIARYLARQMEGRI